MFKTDVKRKIKLSAVKYLLNDCSPKYFFINLRPESSSPTFELVKDTKEIG